MGSHTQSEQVEASIKVCTKWVDLGVLVLLFKFSTFAP